MTAMIPRMLEKRLKKVSRGFPVVYVTGPRQSGKTTLVRAAFPEHAYVNLENPDEREAVRNDPRAFLARHTRRGAIVDEAQRVPELFSYLQTHVDADGRAGKFILSGSQNFLLMESITQSLAGRAAVLNLLPFTWRELSGRPRLTQGEVDRFLFRGMYPGVYARRIPPTEFFSSYISTYVERDVRSLRQIGDLHAFTRFLRLCANRVGQVLNLTSLGNETGADAKTIRAWISILEASFILFLLPPFHRNFNKRIIKSPKLYFYDTGLAAALIGLTSQEQLRDSYMRGSLFENFVVAEVRKTACHAGIPANLFFWRDNTGNEIDLIIEQGTGFSAVEIKSGSTFSQEYRRGLTKFQAYADLPPERSFVVYGSRQPFHSPGTQVLPWTDVAALIGKV